MYLVGVLGGQVFFIQFCCCKWRLKMVSNFDNHLKSNDSFDDCGDSDGYDDDNNAPV